MVEDACFASGNLTACEEAQSGETISFASLQAVLQDLHTCRTFRWDHRDNAVHSIDVLCLPVASSAASQAYKCTFAYGVLDPKPSCIADALAGSQEEQCRCLQRLVQDATGNSASKEQSKLATMLGSSLGHIADFPRASSNRQNVL